MSEGSAPPRREPGERPAGERPAGPPDRSERPPRPGPGGGRGRDRDDDRRGAWSVKAKLRARARKKARKGKKRMFQRRKVCRFCADKKLLLDYKEAKTLRLFVSETGKVTPRRISGTCAKHQRKLALQIKRARQIALLPYAAKHV
jgi:small subunit ribosomal protein S18